MTGIPARLGQATEASIGVESCGSNPNAAAGGDQSQKEAGRGRYGLLVRGIKMVTCGPRIPFGLPGIGSSQQLEPGFVGEVGNVSVYSRGECRLKQGWIGFG